MCFQKHAWRYLSRLLKSAKISRRPCRLARYTRSISSTHCSLLDGLPMGLYVVRQYDSRQCIPITVVPSFHIIILFMMLEIEIKWILCLTRVLHVYRLSGPVFSKKLILISRHSAPWDILPLNKMEGQNVSRRGRMSHHAGGAKCLVHGEAWWGGEGQSDLPLKGQADLGGSLTKVSTHFADPPKCPPPIQQSFQALMENVSSESPFIPSGFKVACVTQKCDHTFRKSLHPWHCLSNDWLIHDDILAIMIT